MNLCINMKIGIYGGTFSPIHKGHIDVIKGLLQKNAVDKIVVLVSGNPPHKTDDVLDGAHRLNMVKLAILKLNAEVSDFEIKQEKKSYTVDTMRSLKEIYKEDDLYFIIGADSYFDLTLWHNYKDLIKENKFIVVNREEKLKKENFESFAKEHKINAVFYDIKTTNVSSSYLRECIKKGIDVSEFVLPDVLNYIKENKLYNLEEEILSKLKTLVSEKRMKHILGVAETARQLAKIFGGSEEKVILSAYLHDIAKEFTLDEMNNLTKDLKLPAEVRNSKALLHGPAGAEYAKKHFNIDDEVYNACFYHTFGRENMSLTEKIVFVSDMIEPGRDFPNLEELRKTAQENIDKAVVMCIDSTISFLTKNKKYIYEDTLKTRNFYIKNMEKNENM